MEEGYGKYVLRQKSIMINSMLFTFKDHTATLDSISPN